MKKILVVGSSGLVGTHFLNLFHKNYNILCVDRHTDTSLELYRENIAALVFLAQSKDYSLLEFTEDLMKTNVSLLRHYLHQLSKKCPKIILFSTGSVYQLSDKIIDENSLLVDHTLTSYVASKIMSELLAKSFSNFYQNIAIVRPFTIYGTGQKATMLFSRLLNNLKSKNPLEVGQSGGMIFNPVHAEDVARFIDYLIQRNSQGVEYFNIFGPQILTLEQVITKMAEILEVTPNIFIQKWPLKKMIANSITHDFIPKINLENGLLKMIVGASTNVKERNFY